MREADFSLAVGAFQKREVGVVFAEEAHTFVVMLLFHEFNMDFHFGSVHFAPEAFSQFRLILQGFDKFFFELFFKKRA